MFLSGSKEATLRDIRLVDIHGTRFFDLLYAHDDAPTQLRTARIAVEDVYDDPEQGDAIMITYLMNMPTSVQRRTASMND